MIDAFTKYILIKVFTDKKAKTVLCGFIEIVNKSKHEPDKVWVNQERKF